MHKTFWNSASARFVNIEEVRQSLRDCAQVLISLYPEIRAIYLFGSYAVGNATPRSDADIVVEVKDLTPLQRGRIWDTAVDIFLNSPVAVDLFVLDTRKLKDDIAQQRGLGWAVARQGLLLAGAESGERGNCL